MYKLILCLRTLRSRRIVYVSVAGVVVGIAVLIVVTSLFEGFSRELRERIRGVTSHIVIERPSGTLDRYEELIALVRKVPHVTAVAPHVEGLVYVNHRGVFLPRGVQMVGIDPARELGTADAQGVSELGRHLVEGDGRLAPAAGAAAPGMLVGTQLLGDRPCPPGEPLRLATILTRPGTYPPDFRYRNVAFTVAGRFRTRMNEYDRGLVYVPLRTAQAFLDLGDTVTQIAVRLDDYRHAPETVDAIRSAFTAAGGLDGAARGLKVLTWEEIPGKRILIQAVEIEKNIQWVILFFIVIVAGFNIIAILSLFVELKTRDIGILRALGATSGGVSGLYLFNGTAIGTAGSILGVLLGIAVAYGLNPLEKAIHHLTGFRLFPPEIYYLDGVPAEVSPQTIALAVGATLAVSLVFSVYPAWKASRLDPLEAIRHE
jgi:lipoprotein-releasing system permease protein